jgi:hypothetical protein
MPRRSLALTALIVAVVVAAAGYLEWSQTKTCGPTSGPKCQAGVRLHPNRAYGLWGLAGVMVVVAGGIALTDRRR